MGASDLQKTDVNDNQQKLGYTRKASEPKQVDNDASTGSADLLVASCQSP